MPLKHTIRPITSSRTLGRVAVWALLMGLYSILPVWKELSRFGHLGDTPADLHAALSLILGCLLVFRTNSAYARWWEARILWGSLVNASRNLAIKLCTLVRASHDELKECEELLKRFPVALMEHLRQASSTSSMSSSTSTDHEPQQISQQLYRWIATRKSELKLDGDELRSIDMELSKLMDVCGACERIAKTPMIRSYKVFSRQCIGLFLITLPWGIASDFGWWTIPMTIIISYFMIGMETVAEHVEEPFGVDEDDLNLESLCVTIDRSVEKIFEAAH
jgi:ion channel-forming bestrophin family protein